MRRNDQTKRTGRGCTAAALAVLLTLSGCGAEAEPTQATHPVETMVQTEASILQEPTETRGTEPPAPTEAYLQLPYLAEEAGLEITEFFESSVPNPDAGDVMAENVASLEIMNRSGQYLQNAVIEVETRDHRVLQFRVRDLPADAVVWAFDTENTSGGQDNAIRTVNCSEVSFSQQEESLLQTVSVETDDLTVTVTNTGTETLENLEIICRCNFGDLYFGGISYCYPVPVLAPGEQITIDAAECYMGTAEVVDIRRMR